MDTWDGGASYEHYMGRWSRRVAQQFLDWIAVPPASRWVDVGCGTGALTEAITQAASPERLAGVDPSSDFIAAARHRLGESPDLRVGDAQGLPFASDEFDAAVSGIALNFVPDPGRGIQEMRRVTRSGGVVAAYVWDYADGMQTIRMFWDAAVALDPTIAHLDEAARFPLCRPERLDVLFRESGLTDVDTTPLVIPTVFAGFGEYWKPFLGGQGPAPSYVVSLTERDRRDLQARLSDELPRSDDGAIELTARAWAVRGIVEKETDPDGR
ncbi:MAG: class I SAM-dependent methyltransferase [Acidimicrobiia bacterium]